jgi:hypothetical protein
MTLELSLSRAEVKRLASRLVTSRDQANYRTLTDIEADKLVRLTFMMILVHSTAPFWPFTSPSPLLPAILYSHACYIGVMMGIKALKLLPYINILVEDTHCGILGLYVPGT